MHPSRGVDLAFAASGRVAEVLAAPGQHVKRGQPLARLDDSALKLELVQAHGGSVAVSSVVARGTTFTVQLPRA